MVQCAIFMDREIEPDEPPRANQNIQSLIGAISQTQAPTTSASV